MDASSATDRLLQGGSDGRIELVEGLGKRACWHPQRLRAHPVESLPDLEDGLGPARSYLLADRRDRQRGIDVERRTRQHVALDALRTEVDPPNHSNESTGA